MNFLGFNVTTDESMKKDEMLMIPIHLKLVLVGNELKIQEGTKLRDITDDERRHFGRIINIAQSTT